MIYGLIDTANWFDDNYGQLLFTVYGPRAQLIYLTMIVADYCLSFGWLSQDQRFNSSWPG